MRFDANGRPIDEPRAAPTPGGGFDANGVPIGDQGGDGPSPVLRHFAGLAGRSPMGLMRRFADELDRRGGNMGAAVAGFRDGISLGFADELAGAESAIGAALTGRDANQAYRSTTDEWRARNAAHQQNHQLAYLGGQIGSAFVPGAGVGNLSRGVGWGGRLALSAGSGAALGGVYGAGSGTTADERLSMAGQGALMGAALGGGLKALGEGGGAAGDALRRLLRLPRGFAGDTLRRLLRLPRDENGNPSAADNADVSVLEDLERVARAAGMSLDEAQEAINRLAQSQPDTMVAEALGNSGVQRLQFLARARGQTGDVVEDYVTQRNRNQLGQLEDAFLRGESTGDALEEMVSAAWKADGKRLYEPVLATAPRAEALRDLQSSPLFRHRAVQAAWSRAGQMVQDGIDAGQLPANAAGSVSYRLHYTKVALSNMVDNPATLEPGLANIENANLTSVARQFSKALDDVLPGYGSARARLADLGQARRAIEAGRDLFGARFPREQTVRRFVDGLSAGEMPYWRAGVEDAIQQRFVRAARDGRTNVANVALGEDFVRRLRAALGADEADAMIERARRLAQNFETGARVRPSRGSPTANMMFEAAEGAPPIPSQSSALNSAWNWGWQNTVGRLNEKHRDALGRVYTMPVSEAARGGLISRARAARARADQASRAEKTRNAALAGFGSIGIL